jgi:hypothetical protein
VGGRKAGNREQGTGNRKGPRRRSIWRRLDIRSLCADGSYLSAKITVAAANGEETGVLVKYIRPFRVHPRSPNARNPSTSSGQAPGHPQRVLEISLGPGPPASRPRSALARCPSFLPSRSPNSHCAPDDGNSMQCCSSRIGDKPSSTAILDPSGFSEADPATVP